MKKYFKYLLLVVVLLIPFIVNAEELTDNQKALKETADAFLRKSGQAFYSTQKNMNNATPEMATSQSFIYTQCASFVRYLYSDALNVKLTPHTLKLGGCAYQQMSAHPEVVRKAWIRDEEGYDKPESMTLNSLTSVIKAGDIIVSVSDNGGHTVLVYDVDGENTRIIESNDNVGESISSKVKLLYDGSIHYVKLTDRMTFYRTQKYVFVIRPLGDGNVTTIDFDNITHAGGSKYDMSRYTCLEKTQTVALTDSAKCRNRYSNMDINKTVSGKDKTIIDKSEVEVGDTLIYNIEIKNNSASPYTGLSVEEELSDYVKLVETPNNAVVSGNKIKWENIEVSANNSINISYKVIVKNKAVGKDIISKGKVCNIPSATVKNYVSVKLSKGEKNKIIETYKNTNETDSVKLINKVYGSIGMKDLFNNFKIDELIDANFNYTNPKTININDKNKYAKLILNNNYYGGKTHINNSGQYYLLRYWEKTWGMGTPSENPEKYVVSADYRSPMADTVFKEHFETGDVLFTFEDNKLQAYIYLNDGQTLNKFYNKNGSFPTTDNTLHYNNLLENDLYVVLRPSKTRIEEYVEVPNTYLSKSIISVLIGIASIGIGVIIFKKQIKE
ncbi:MAG: hypothetical protein IJ097_03220 [Bacilli bacterium]|nr:hypothetical protein [Bacilli bacterium]